MEKTYLIVGKRFQARNITDLAHQLNQYGLVPDEDAFTVTHPSSEKSYDMVQSYGDSADFLGLDVVVGKLINETGRGQDIVEVEDSDLEAAVREIRQIIPDAKLIAGSYWI